MITQFNTSFEINETTRSIDKKTSDFDSTTEILKTDSSNLETTETPSAQNIEFNSNDTTNNNDNETISIAEAQKSSNFYGLFLFMLRNFN